MSSRDKLLFFVKMGAMTLILYTITIGVYFLWFYKPYVAHEISSVNEIYRDIHQDGIKLFFLLSFFACFFVSTFILLIYEEIVFYNKPIIEVYATCKLKEGDTNINVSSKGGTTVVNTYKLTFELENGDEMSFPVRAKHYMTILEGNKGIMKYKEGRANRYVGFELKEVE